MHITSIETNIRTPGGILAENLGAHVFITGANATGKTSLLNAITLGLAGFAEDLGVKESVKSAPLLADLLPFSEKKLFTRITLSSGDICSWELTPGKKAIHNIPEGLNVLFPLAEVEKALKATGVAASRPGALRFWFKYFINDDDVSFTRMSEDVDLYKVALPYIEQFLDVESSRERILLVEETASKAQRAHNAAARVLKTTITKLSEGLSTKKLDNKTQFQLRLATTLESFLEMQKSEVCGVCGSKIDPKIFASRLQKVRGALKKLPKVSPVIYQTIQELETARGDLLERAKLAASVVSHCQNVMEETVKDFAPRICKEVSEHLKFLPYKAGFGIEFGKNTINTGLIRDNEGVRPYFCGAERVQVVAAVCAALAKHQPEDTLTVLMTPDKALDLASLSALLRAMRKVEANVYVQSPFVPKGRPINGYTRVTLDSFDPGADDAE